MYTYICVRVCVMCVYVCDVYDKLSNPYVVCDKIARD